LLSAQAAPAVPETDGRSRICGTIDDCIGLLTGAVADGRSSGVVAIGVRLAEHGREGADALVPLLAHPSDDISRRAGWALEEFEESLDARHVPALIDAHKRGLDVAKVIARIGSDEALRYLESAAVPGDEDNGALEALGRLGQRAVPFLLRELERCRAGCTRRAAWDLLYTLNRIDPLPEQAKAVIRDVAASRSTEPALRDEMEDQLISRAMPEALPILVRRLAELRGHEHEDPLAAGLIERLDPHGKRAIAGAGPAILLYLSRRDLRQARLAAILAAWEIDYHAAVPHLRAVLADADRDWLAAYQALSALAELGGREARPDIERLARGHWYRPVRNSARRALNRLDGGEFELPERRGRDERGGYEGEVNFAADVESERDCRFDRAGEIRFARDAPVRPRWPRHGVVRVALEPPSSEAFDALKHDRQFPLDSTLTLDWRRAEGRIVAVDAGPYEGGGLFAVAPGGALRRILADSVLAVFRMRDQLFVFTGVPEISDTGELWRLAPHGELAVLDGPLRLPAMPRGFALASDRTLLIRTNRGDLAVSPRGRLLRARPCPGPSPTL
jgi:hypothetical protein